MKHSSTYPFRRWYRKSLTVREAAVIGLLERRRRRTGRVSIVLTVPAAEHAAISRLLLHYALFLNNRCTLNCTILVATTSTTPHSTLPTPHCTPRRQVLEEYASVINLMISSALHCIHGARGSPLHGKFGELASVGGGGGGAPPPPGPRGPAPALGRRGAPPPAGCGRS